MTGAAVVSGVPWFDDRGAPVNAHGGCLLAVDGRFLLFGEHKTDDENVFCGFSCYSSPDLVHWTFERFALPVQADGLLGPGRVGERVKVLRSPATGRYVLFAHSDSPRYDDPCTVVATSWTPEGPYDVLGALPTPHGPLRRWDIGAFQGADGTGYLLVHEGDVHRLSADFLRVEETVATGVAPGGESPAAFEHEGTFFLLVSQKTSWERNDNHYLTAPSMAGPWTHRGTFAPPGTNTWNSQCSSVFPLPTAHGTVPVLLGDRWSFPHQASAATQVWQPLSVDGDVLSLPEFLPAWDPATAAPVPLRGTAVDVGFDSSARGTTTEVGCRAGRFALVGPTDDRGGYGLVEVLDAAGAVHVSSLVDFHSRSPDVGLRYVSPHLPARPESSGGWTVRLTVTGEAFECFQKDGTRFGSTGCRVAVDTLLELP